MSVHRGGRGFGHLCRGLGRPGDGVVSPNAFTFTDITGAAVSSPETSNTITISGLPSTDTAVAFLTGDASSQLSYNGGAWQAGPVIVVNGDTVAVRHTSSGSASTSIDTVLTVGGRSDTFTSTTASPANTLDAPVLTKTSASTVNPPEWDSDNAGYISWDGSANGDTQLMRWRRVNGGAWTTEAEQGLDDELLTGGFTWPLLEAAKPLAGGYFEAQEQRVRYVAGVETARSAWSNSVVDASLAGPSTPQPPTDATVKAWWSMADIAHLWKDTAGTSAVTADGDLVARIDDQSGNGRHLLQATSGLRPLYKTTVSLASSVTTSGSPTVTVGSSVGLTAGSAYGITGTGIAGSTYISAIVDATHITLSANATASGTVTLTATVKPYLLFDGTDDYMASAGFTAESQPFYQGHAVTPSSIATTRQIFNGGDTTHKMGLMMNTAGNSWATDCGTTVNVYSKPMTTNPAVICALMQGSGNSFVRLNGSQSSTGFDTGSQQVNGYTLGANPSFSQNWIGKWRAGFVRAGAPATQLKTDYDTWLTLLNP